MSTSFVEWHNETMAKRVVKSFENNGFQAYYSRTRNEAIEKVLELVPKDAKVGTGGSMTIRELELPRILAERGNVVVRHDASGQKSSFEMRRETLLSDVFLASANAVTLDGKLVNIDGGGNRVAAMSFGPKKTIIVVGINKVTRDLDSAIWRVKNVAAPMNVRRLNMKAPCASDGFCSECTSEDRICKAILILEKMPSYTDYHIVVVGERLGF